MTGADLGGGGEVAMRSDLSGPQGRIQDFGNGGGGGGVRLTVKY